MLQHLYLRDFVIVDESDIPFGPGCTVLSGETGAGKSILIDALSLVLGARADATLVREGSERAELSARFTPPPGLAAWLAEHDLADGDDDALLLRRVIDRNGRSRAYINGTPASLAQLRELARQLIDIHGQHAHQQLLEPASQRLMLDAQGGLQDAAAAVEHAWRQWQQAQADLRRATEGLQAGETLRAQLQWQLDALEPLSPQPGQWDEIQAEHAQLSHGHALLEGAGQAQAALDAGARAGLSQALHVLQPLLAHDARLGDILDSIQSADSACAQAISDLNRYADRLNPDPARLAEVEQALSAWFETARKLRVAPEALPAHHEALLQQWHTLSHHADLDDLRQAAEAAQAHYDVVAAQLSEQRRAAAQRLGDQVTEAMQTLAMAGGRFQVAVRPAPPSAHGMDQVVFEVAGHAGVTPRPLSKVASGGELARLSLALSVIASQAAQVPTLIFDEVDTGIGGAVAEVVGRLLAALGERHQVLCVTHLPQVAARGTHHYRVHKHTRDGATQTAVDILNDEARVEEIARMLGGLHLTETTRQHARELLHGAEPAPSASPRARGHRRRTAS